MAYIYNVKLMLFFYVMISCKHLIQSATSSTSGFTTVSASVSVQSVISQSAATSISPSTSHLNTTTSTSASTISSPSLLVTPSSILTEASMSGTASTSTSNASTEKSLSVSTASSPSVLLSTHSSIITVATISGTDSTSTSPATSTSVSTTSYPAVSIVSSLPTSTTPSEASTSLTASTSTSPASTEPSTSVSLTSSPSVSTITSSLPSSSTQSKASTTRTASTSTSHSPSSPPTVNISTSYTTGFYMIHSLRTYSISMNKTILLLLSTIRATASSESPTISANPTQLTILSSTASPATIPTSTIKSTTMTTPPNSVVVDLDSHTFGLNFSVSVNLKFQAEYNDKKSESFANLSADFTTQLTPIYRNTPGFKYIQINGFTQGSVIANYSVVVSASIEVKEIVSHIQLTVIDELKNLTIREVKVNITYIETTMKKELASQKNYSRCELSNPCRYGFKCQDWNSDTILCTDRCDSQVCVHGTCYIDHLNENVLKCRCPTEDDGYVYSGERCEHKSLSTLIIITSAVGGGVLLAAFVIICVICIKMKRNREESDDIPLDSLPDYSKYFPRSNTYQPKYGYNQRLVRGRDSESHNLDGKSGYITCSGDFHDNTTYTYDNLDHRSDDNSSEVRQERHAYDYIGMDRKFEIMRPQFR